MLISVYSDSTAIPRRNLIHLSETWPEILVSNLREKSEHEIFLLNRSFGGIEFSELLKLFNKDSKYYYNQDKSNCFDFASICIFTSGIVDGSPRPITYKLKVLNKIPFIGTWLWSKTLDYLHAYRPSIQSRFSYTPVSIKKFSRELNNLVAIAKDLNIYVILLETPPPHSHLELRSPGILNSIQDFNKIKNQTASSLKNVKFVKLSDFFNDNNYISEDDGHHFNYQGHLAIAEVLTEAILKITNKHE